MSYKNLRALSWFLTLVFTFLFFRSWINAASISTEYGSPAFSMPVVLGYFMGNAAIPTLFWILTYYKSEKERDYKNQQSQKISNELKIGNTIYFLDIFNNLQSGIINRLDVDQNQIFSFQVSSAENQKHVITIEDGEKLFKKLEYAELKCGLVIHFKTFENKLIHGIVKKVSIEEADKITGCFILDNNNQEWELSENEGDILFTEINT